LFSEYYFYHISTFVELNNQDHNFKKYGYITKLSFIYLTK
jgi:hypothetical protein